MLHIVVLGSSGVGKSALVIRYVSNKFIDFHDSTIEEMYEKKETFDDGVSNFLEIFDTSGSHEFCSMVDQRIREADGFLLMYDVTSRPSFEILSTLHENIKTIKSLPYIPLVLVGNKCDVKSEKRVIQHSDGYKLSKKFACSFLETSAKEAIHSDKAFIILIESMKSKKIVHEPLLTEHDQQKPSLEKKNQDKQSRSRCCCCYCCSNIDKCCVKKNSDKSFSERKRICAKRRQLCFLNF